MPEDMGLKSKVFFTGYRRDIPQIMAASDIVAHCSIYPDPFPGVVLQGMSLGKPVVASDLGGPREQIEDRISGLLVEPNNPSALAEAICALQSQQEYRAAMGEAAADRATSVFSTERFLSRLSDVYASLITEGQGTALSI